MEHRIECSADERVIRISGRLTFNDHAAFSERIISTLEDGKTRNIVDLSGLEFIDSAGIGMLLIAADHVAKLGGKLAIRGARGQVGRVFEVARLSQMLTIE